MSLSEVLKKVKREATVSSLFPITHFLTPSVFCSQSGCVGAVLSLKGVPFAIASPDALNSHSFLLHQALMLVDSRFVVQVSIHRKRVNTGMEPVCGNQFQNLLDEKWRQRMQGRQLHENALFLTLILK